MKMSVSYPDDLSYDNIKHSDSEAMNKWRTEAINIILEEKEKGSYEARIDFFFQLRINLFRKPWLWS